ncbi:MAG: zinc ribbon domain-containing protein [Gammaproteobacteria bacterium]|nr:zinc ribbon domain-containing protein [Gammaproteobacteria bacterium]
MENSFITYVILWAILGLIFYFLDKREKSIKKRQRLSTIGVASIFLLMYLFIFIQSGISSWPIGIFLLLLMLGAIHTTLNYTYYCEQCSKRHQMLGKKANFCPSCGGKLIK